MTKKAFTLIELLVVIAIIALLLAILVPSLKAVKEYASIVNCLSNQKSLAMATIMFGSDNDEKFPSGYLHRPGRNLRTGVSWDTVQSWILPPLQYGSLEYVGGGDNGIYLLNLDARLNGFREGALWPYLESPKTFHCPGDPRLRKGGTGTWGPRTPPRYYQMYNSYGMPDFYAWTDADNEHKEDSLTNLKPGGQKMLFVEYQYDDHYYNSDAWSYIPYDNKFWDPLGNYHNKGCTFSFVDGHAEQYRWKDWRTMIFMSDRKEAKRRGFGKGDFQVGNDDFQWLDSHYPAKTRHGD